MNKCIKCGSPAELLLNLVCCTKAQCQNFDVKFHKKWLVKCGRAYPNPNNGWKFLGQYCSTKPVGIKRVTKIYDLYSNGPEVYAVGSDRQDEVLAGDTNGEPIGYYMNWFWGPEMVDATGRDALAEAAARKNI